MNCAVPTSANFFVISSSSFRKKSSSRTIHIVIVISIVMLTGNLQFVCRKKGQKSIVSTGGNGSAQLSDNERERKTTVGIGSDEISGLHHKNTTQSSRRACLLYFVMIAHKTHKNFQFVCYHFERNPTHNHFSALIRLFGWCLLWSCLMW